MSRFKEKQLLNIPADIVASGAFISETSNRLQHSEHMFVSVLPVSMFVLSEIGKEILILPSTESIILQTKKDKFSCCVEEALILPRTEKLVKFQGISS